MAKQVSEDFTIFDPSFSFEEHFYRIVMIECVGFLVQKSLIQKKQAI
ncbi:MAG: hypothetical protein R3A45_02515 [Bdellovibrionota bacterium]